MDSVWVFTTFSYIALLCLLGWSRIRAAWLYTAFAWPLAATPVYVILEPRLGPNNAYWAIDLICLGLYTRVAIWCLKRADAHINTMGMLMVIYNVLDLISLLCLRTDYNFAVSIQYVLRYMNVGSLMVYFLMILLYARERGEIDERKDVRSAASQGSSHPEP